MNLPGREYEGEAPVEKRGEGGLADDAAKKSESVRADLNGREELAWMLLQIENELGAAIAVIRKHGEPGAACRGERNFSAAKKGAEADEKRKAKQFCVNRHKIDREYAESAIVTWGCV